MNKENELVQTYQDVLEYPEIFDLFKTESDVVELPSLGKLYRNHKKSLVVEYMVSKDEDIITAPNLASTGTQFDVLLKKKIKDKDINVEEMLAGDYWAILLFLRATGIGNEYEVQVTDPKNGKKFKSTINLGELKYKFLEETPDKEGLFDYTLPKSGIQVKFKLLTMAEDRQYQKMVENQQKNSLMLGASTSFLKMHIKKFKHPQQDVWFDSADNRMAKYFEPFITKMSVGDAQAFREYVEKISPGVDMSWEFQSPYTGEFFRSTVQPDLDLFYPKFRNKDNEDETATFIS